MLPILLIVAVLLALGALGLTILFMGIFRDQEPQLIGTGEHWAILIHPHLAHTPEAQALLTPPRKLNADSSNILDLAPAGPTSLAMMACDPNHND